MNTRYNIFISHSWAYSDAYEKLLKLLDKDTNFTYFNYSVPKDDPIHTNGSDKELYNAIKEQMSHASVVIILAGVYSSYSKWIDKEISIAENEFSTRKKIIAVEPWGSERTSLTVKSAADRIIGWNSESVIRAIKELAL